MRYINKLIGKQLTFQWRYDCIGIVLILFLIKVPLCSNECLLFCSHGKLVVECSVTRNHMAMLQCNYQVINVQATSDSDNTMHVFMVNLFKLYTGGQKWFHWCISNYFELEIYPPWSHVYCGNVAIFVFSTV